MKGARFLSVALIGLFALWLRFHLTGFQWDTDEGINLVKADLVAHGYPLYSQVWSDQPPGFTWALAEQILLIGRSVEAARMISGVHAVAALLAILMLLRQITGYEWAGLCAAAFLVIAPNFYWLSRAVMLTLPATSLALLSLALAVRSGRNGIGVFNAGILLGLATLEKWVAIAALFADGVAILLAVRHDKPAGIIKSLLLLVTGVTVPLALSALFVPILPFWNQVVRSPLTARGAFGQWSLTSNLAELELYLTADNLGLTVLALYGLLVLLWRKLPAAWPLVAWVAVQIALALLQHPLWPRHHFIGVLLGLASLAGYGAWVAIRAVYIWLTSTLQPILHPTAATVSRSTLLVAIAGATAMLIYLVTLPWVLQVDARLGTAHSYDVIRGQLPVERSYRTAEETSTKITATVQPGGFIVTDYPMIAFRAGSLLPPWIAVLSRKRIESGQVTSVDLITATQVYRPTAILFWDQKLSDFSDYNAWLSEKYHLADKIGNNRELWVLNEP